MNNHNMAPENADPEIMKLINELIYDYLTKQGYQETSESFKKETSIDLGNRNEFTTLLELVTMFLATLDTRCGKIRQGADYHRIEAVMMRINAEKQRCMLVVSPNKFGFMNEQARPAFSPRQRRSYSDYPRERNFMMEEESGDVKVIKINKPHPNRCYTGVFAQNSCLYFSCGAEGNLVLLNLINHETTVKGIHKPPKAIKCKEVGGEIIVALGFYDAELHLFKFINNTMVHVSGIQTPGAPILAFEFTENALFTLDGDGKFVMWSLSGKFSDLGQLGVPITEMVFFSNSLILSENTKVSFVSPCVKELPKPFLQHPVTFIKRSNDYLLVGFQNLVHVYDSKLERVQAFETPAAVKTACLLKNGHLVVACDTLLFINGKKSGPVRFATPIVAVDGYSERENQFLIVMFFDGESKILKVL